MNFSFTDDQTLLKNSARALLDEHCKPEHVRAMQEDTRGYGEALWGDMAKLGWLGLPFPEQYGGAGLGLVELALLHEEMGRVAYPGPFLATVVLGGLPLLLGGLGGPEGEVAARHRLGARAADRGPPGRKPRLGSSLHRHHRRARGRGLDRSRA